MAMAYNGYVAFGKEATRGTKVARTVFDRFEAADIIVDLTPIIPRHSQNRYDNEALPGPVMASLQATIEVRADSIGEWLRTLLWTDPVTTSLGSGVFEHVFTPPAQLTTPVMKPYTGEVRYGTAAVSRLVTGLVGDQGTFQWDREMLKLAAELFGFKPETLGTPTSPTFVDVRPFLFHQLSVLSRDSGANVNGGFETWTTSPGVPNSWTDISGADATFAKELTIKRSGTQAAKITAGAAPTVLEGMKQDIISPIVGDPLYIEVWARTAGVTGEQAVLEIFNVTDTVIVATISGTDAITSFEKLSTTFTPASGKTYTIRLIHGGTPATGQIVYFDDVFVGTSRSVRSGQIQVQNSPTKEHASGSRYSEDPEAGVATLEVQFTQRLNDLKDLKRMWSQDGNTDSPDDGLGTLPTYVDLVLRWVGGVIGSTAHRYELEFNCPSFFIGGFSAPLTAGGEIVETVSFKPLYDSATTKAISVRLKNGISAY